MRIITTIFFFICLNHSLSAQYFPGKEVELLLGKELSIKEKDLDSHLSNFFLKFDNKKRKFKIRKKNKPFPIKTKIDKTYKTEYSRLKNHTFLVDTFLLLDTHEIRGQEYAIKLISEELGELWYHYRPIFESEFELCLSLVDLPEGYLCDQIQSDIDKFDGNSYEKSPNVNTLSFGKSIENSDTIVFLRLFDKSSSLDIEAKGVYLLFDDGSKLAWPDIEIDVTVSESSLGVKYLYTGLVSLNSKEIAQILDNEITDSRLHRFDNEYSKEQNLFIDRYLKCLSN